MEYLLSSSLYAFVCILSTVPNGIHTHTADEKSKSSQSVHVIPVFVESLPSDTHQPRAASSGEDDKLQLKFPGQFFTAKQVDEIDRLENRRPKRVTDDDLCCPTDLWFGTAPSKLNDTLGGGPHIILQGKHVFQAYSRGECSNTSPRPGCPGTGVCKQKNRLQTLWVRIDKKAKLKYFLVKSHCAYEPP